MHRCGNPHPELGDMIVIFLEVGVIGGTEEPMGFNCGTSNITRAEVILDEVREALANNTHVKVHALEMRDSDAGDDFVIPVRCEQGWINRITDQLKREVALMRRRQQII